MRAYGLNPRAKGAEQIAGFTVYWHPAGCLCAWDHCAARDE
jgi:hypothetical protein